MQDSVLAGPNFVDVVPFAHLKIRHGFAISRAASGYRYMSRLDDSQISDTHQLWRIAKLRQHRSEHGRASQEKERTSPRFPERFLRVVLEIIHQKASF